MKHSPRKGEGGHPGFEPGQGFGSVGGADSEHDAAAARVLGAFYVGLVDECADGALEGGAGGGGDGLDVLQGSEAGGEVLRGLLLLEGLLGLVVRLKNEGGFEYGGVDGGRCVGDGGSFGLGGGEMRGMGESSTLSRDFKHRRRRGFFHGGHHSFTKIVVVGIGRRDRGNRWI